MKLKLTTILTVTFLFSIFAFIGCSNSGEIDDLRQQIEELREELEEKEETAYEEQVEEVTEEEVIEEEVIEEEVTEEEVTEEEVAKEEVAKEEVAKVEEFKIGDEIIVSDEYIGENVCSVIIHSIENFTDYGKYDEPNEGMRDIVFDVEIKNLSNEVQSYNPNNYNLRDNDYYRYDNRGGGRKEPRLSSGELSPGDKVRGWVTLEVPKGVTVTEILAETCYCGPPAIIKLDPPISP
jgi:hypothetical protein